VLELHGSGGRVIADVTDEQAKKADLGVANIFLLQLESLRNKACRNIFARNVNLSLMARQKFRLKKVLTRQLQTD
jgi:hypothetical protein